MDTQTKAEIRSARDADGSVLAAIYNYYIDNAIVTFETEAVGAEDMAGRVRDTLALGLPWLVAEFDGRIAGYAYASKWKGRCAYRYSVEATIYLDETQTSKGIGLPLYRALMDAIQTAGMHSVIAGIALPNDASIRLHERLGFSKIGQFVEVGNKFDRWIDVGYWQLIFDE